MKRSNFLSHLFLATAAVLLPAVATVHAQSPDLTPSPDTINTLNITQLDNGKNPGFRAYAFRTKDQGEFVGTTITSCEAGKEFSRYEFIRPEDRSDIVTQLRLRIPIADETNKTIFYTGAQIERIVQSPFRNLPANSIPIKTNVEARNEVLKDRGYRILDPRTPIVTVSDFLKETCFLDGLVGTDTVLTTFTETYQALKTSDDAQPHLRFIPPTQHRDPEPLKNFHPGDEDDKKTEVVFRPDNMSRSTITPRILATQ